MISNILPILAAAVAPATEAAAETAAAPAAETVTEQAPAVADKPILENTLENTGEVLKQIDEQGIGFFTNLWNNHSDDVIQIGRASCRERVSVAV